MQIDLKRRAARARRQAADQGLVVDRQNYSDSPVYGLYRITEEHTGNLVYPHLIDPQTGRAYEYSLSLDEVEAALA